MTYAPAAERVAKGSALLDRVKPGWRERIDPDVLDVENPFCCVLGQTFGDYISGLVELHLSLTQGSTSYGFCGTAYSEYPELNAAWREELVAA